MFSSKEDKLMILASKGDHLAEYYLGRYYLEEKNEVRPGITVVAKIKLWRSSLRQ